jgi:membrane protein YdbS with pleckstrin-like domain
MLQWLEERSRYLWLSLAIGVVAAVVAWPSFTDPWPSNAGGFVFVVAVVTAVVRGSIALGHAFRQGWEEPGRPAAR